MRPVSAAALLRPVAKLFRRPLAVILLPAALAAAAAPAAAQTPCAGPGWVPHDVVNYNFAWLSERRGNLALHCVRNHHPRRGLFVDWQGAGLRSAIPPGETIFRASPLIGRPSRRAFPFFFGARPNEISVPTLAGLAGPGPGLAGLSAGPALLRAAYGQAAARDLPTAGNLSLVYVPVGAAFRENAETLRDSPPALIEWLETHPDQLGAFAMSFDNSLTVGANGRISVAWRCTYRLALAAAADPLLYLRFTDADLHRRMFGGDEPSPVRGWRGGEIALAAVLPPVAPRRLEARTAQLQVLLADRSTIVATIPVAYSGPSGS